MIKKFFKTLYRYWMIFVKKLAIIPTTILLSIIYFSVVGLTSLVNFIARKDLLDKRFQDKDSFWHDKELIPVDFERCKRQF